MLDTKTAAQWKTEAQSRLALQADQDASRHGARNIPATKLRRRPSVSLAALATLLLASCAPREEARVAPGFGPEAGPPPGLSPRPVAEPLPAIKPKPSQKRVAAVVPPAKVPGKAPAEKAAAKPPVPKTTASLPAPKREARPAREAPEKAPPVAMPRLAAVNVKTIARNDAPASPPPARTDGPVKVTPVSAAPAGVAVVEARIKRMAADIATELAARCPIADPADQKALASCRTALYGGSKIRNALADVTTWGRQHRDPAKRLIDTNLTKFAPDVLTGMYLPLFMFTGTHSVTYVPEEQLYRVELAAASPSSTSPSISASAACPSSCASCAPSGS